MLSGAVRAQACIDVCLATVAPDSCHDAAGNGSEDDSGSDEHEHGAPLSKKGRADSPCGGVAERPASLRKSNSIRLLSRKEARSTSDSSPRVREV